MNVFERHSLGWQHCGLHKVTKGDGSARGSRWKVEHDEFRLRIEAAERKAEGRSTITVPSVARLQRELQLSLQLRLQDPIFGGRYSARLSSSRSTDSVISARIPPNPSVTPSTSLFGCRRNRSGRPSAAPKRRRTNPRIFLGFVFWRCATASHHTPLSVDCSTDTHRGEPG